MVKTAPRRTDNTKGLITLDDASKRLGLAADFLKWALDNDFLAGVNQNDGQWRLRGADLKAGFDGIDGELATHEEAAATVADPRGGAGDSDLGVAADGDPRARPMPDDASLLPEVLAPDKDGSDEESGAHGGLPHPVESWAAGRGSTGASDRLLAEKDALIADLSRALARLAEDALARVPTARRDDDS